MKKSLLILLFIYMHINIQSQKQSIFDSNKNLLHLQQEFDQLNQQRKQYYRLSKMQFIKEIDAKNFLYIKTAEDILKKYQKPCSEFTDSEFFAMIHSEVNNEIVTLKEKMIPELLEKNSYDSLKKCLEKTKINTSLKKFDLNSNSSCSEYTSAQYSTAEPFIKAHIKKECKWDYFRGNPIRITNFLLAIVLANDPINSTH